MDKKLLFQALFKFIAGLIMVGVLVFLPAGTLSYWNGWLLMAVVFGPMPLLGAILLWKSPELLRKRLNTKEQEDTQKHVVALSALMFLAGFAAAGVSFRFGWLMLPRWISCLAALFYLLSYVLYGWVLRENAYLSRTVEVQEGQRVIDTGPYAIVRHPMYAATVLLFFSMPLMLGSIAAAAIFLVYFPIIGKRIQNEEAVLTKGLPGYRDYCQRVKYRLLPFIW